MPRALLIWVLLHVFPRPVASLVSRELKIAFSRNDFSEKCVRPNLLGAPLSVIFNLLLLAVGGGGVAVAK